MQRPAEMRWSQPKCLGEIPSKRSGHTMSNIGDFAFVFGGCTQKRPPGPVNELYKVDMSGTEFYWSNIEAKTRAPESRWKHSANVFGNKIIVFGGFASSSVRYNDVWILDCATEAWAQPTNGITDLQPDGTVVFKRDWLGCPSPRGAHATAIIGRKLYVFGGYGGYGYARRDFNDIYTLDLDAWEWNEVIPLGGDIPDPRSSHQCAAIHNKLYIFGGWNAAKQFDDVYSFDIETLIWTRIESACGPASWGVPRWNFNSLSIEAVPYWKIFSFGGNSGNLTATNTTQGTYLNDLTVLETGNHVWSHPEVVGQPPAVRSEVGLAYEPSKSRLTVFGGWADKWHGDCFTCDVSDVVGPSYSVETITPRIGPVTGSTTCDVSGMGFLSCGSTSATIRFACMKGYMETSGEIVNNTLLRFNTPDFQRYGSVPVECRVALGTKPFTNSTVPFLYFSVTDSRRTVAFGPGVQTGFAAGFPVQFIIQAKDGTGFDRVCGMDQFSVLIVQDKTSKSVSRPTTSVATEEKQSDNSYELEEKSEQVLSPSNSQAMLQRVSAAGKNNMSQTITDNQDGTYTVEFSTPAEGGRYQIYVDFMGTFDGIQGPIRGSPFYVESLSDKEPYGDAMDGQTFINSIKAAVKDAKEYSQKTVKGLNPQISKDTVVPLVRVKEHLKGFESKRTSVQLSIDSSRAALTYLKKKGVAGLDKIFESLDSSASLWQDVVRQVPLTTAALAPITKQWSGTIGDQIDEYGRKLETFRSDFRRLDMWKFEVGPTAARKIIGEAEMSLDREAEILKSNEHLCNMFDFPNSIKKSKDIMEEMRKNAVELKKMWDTTENLLTFIASCRGIVWKGMSLEEIEDASKLQLKAVKNLNKDIRWCDALRQTEKIVKDFVNTLPLISLLCAKCMRRRHWQSLKKLAKKEFALPEDDPLCKLGDILALNLHECSADVEEIADQASKEEKMEKNLKLLGERWQAIVWAMELYKDTDVPLLKILEDDYEVLENDQLTVQGMLASRFVKQFEAEANDWQKQLAMVSDVYILLQDIQRTWSYLEPLFIRSEEVKRELPEDARRFVSIDADVRGVLKPAWELKNIRAGCNQDALYPKLEGIQAQLEICKKSLADFLDSRRRQFPRYYFTSESDLLDILSNGSNPEKALFHAPKIYLSSKSIQLSSDLSATGRPCAEKIISGVGVEEVDLEPRVPLEGKVEIYMQTIVDGIKSTLFQNLQRSLARYQEISRVDWVMHKLPNSKRPSDPAQIILITLAVNYVNEVEQAFQSIAMGYPNAMKEYNAKQVEQLSDLIRLTQLDLSKTDRTRIMVCITMDSHGRDIVEGMIRDNILKIDAFQWQSQLKHKWRLSPASAPFQSHDPHLRGPNKERAEVAIADAVIPYDYEYLGNGPRLVITPLTDRIYVTATQALNLKMGCAPAGPAGTGKTETTKDLANGLAKCCYVFNCSPEMDYLGMGNIFKGLSSSGAWGCFDEFNRLIPEVLSVCSVQFKSVCDGVKAESARIIIEGDEVSLDPTCGVFITMNPGYIGRSELPEGLKALFRPITVMVPDLVLICENMLMAEGFVTAKVLASKFYGLYSLLRELLSKQLHYDWGLRAVKSVLVVAGGFKRAEPNLREDALLMRALRDFNTPKIVREDSVVFFGLLGDLFPGLDPPRKVDVELETSVEKACEILGNWPDEQFRLKIVQLEELLAIRHCVFVMGPPGSGKSQCWRTLAQAKTLRGDKTKFVDINPKSLRTDELYGYISMATREWRDGLLSKVMRELGQIPDEKSKWLVLDGDLDTNWIESMNSVMDDNKMLTLASNERIPLKGHMRMLFEIRDLRFASPATVSRAGILYISTDDGTQWRSLINSWLAKREDNDANKHILRTCFDTYVAETIRWMKKYAKTIVSLEEMNSVTSLLSMLDSILVFGSKILSAGGDGIAKCFVYCMIWSMGSALTISDDGIDYRKMFSDWWRGEWREVKLPSQYSVFDYWFNSEEFIFELWSKSPFLATEMIYDPSVPMTSVTVPTPETVSVTYWMKLLVGLRSPVMLTGPAGTGKTQLVKGLLFSLNPEEMIGSTVNFNFYTTSAVLQNTMGIPLVKKTGTNYGPPGQCRLIYFVDDLNLPEVDQYDTQSSIALLRQYMEYEHIYELAKLQAKNIQNTQVIVCMNPTAGSFQVDPRLQRWFATFAIGLPETMSLHTIYVTFLTGHLKAFAQEVQDVCKDLVRASVNLHREVMSSFKKTATNFHYEFNIRHISNVFQGLLVSKPDQFQSSEKFVHLWMHESERVYADRLVSLEDIGKYKQIVQGQAKRVFPSLNISRFFSNEKPDPLVFCHFSDTIQDKMYDQVSSMDKMTKTLEDALHEYNEMNAIMDLVMFEDAVKHVARIVRIVSNSGGHALLVGVGGSGKQSLARLSAFICGFIVVQIVISSTYSLNDFKDDLKAMYNKAGLKEEGVMFLLTDSQITNERFLVYLNDLLASGDVPDLFATEEIDGIVNSVTNKVKALGKVPDKPVCWDYFITQIKKNLHVVLAFSPVGTGLRSRARKFPALVNCTVIDWFQPWPRDALFSVGKKMLTEVELGSDGIRASIERFLPYSFEEVNKLAVKFLANERRAVYTTPKSFLELLKLYGKLLEKKRAQADNNIDRLSNGLFKLRETGDAVTRMEAELKIKLEEAEQKRIVAEDIAETVSKEKATVEVETRNAQLESEQVLRIQTEVSIKQRDTENDLARAIPAVEAAMAALDTLNKKDLGECKTMAKPPAGVDDVFAATLVLLAGVMPAVIVQKNGRVKERGWDASKRQLLQNVQEYIDYLKSMKDAVDTGMVPAINWQEIRPYLELEHFQPDIIRTKNSSAAGLCSFIVNIVIYYDIVTTVEPKRRALAQANADLEAANSRLKVVQDKLAELQAKLAKLTVEYERASKEKQEAMDSVERGQRKLDMAQRLINALASENQRWAVNVVTMEQDKELLTGDVLLASAFISYVSPFTKVYREKLLNGIFVPFLKKEFKAALSDGKNIPMSENANPVKILTTDAEIAKWNQENLPADQVSTENAAVVCNSARFPLLIDPQLQGIKWIKTKEKNLFITRLGQNDMIRKLERALENGNSFLIENIGESIDAVLNPVIQRATIKRGHKYYIKLGDTEVEMHPNFKLFLHTKLSNPHYPPEIQAETTLVNFTVTFEGLEDQLLSLVVRKERAELATLSEELIYQQNGFKIKMKELEDSILSKLAAAQGDITDDVELIEGLEETKRIAVDIETKSKLALETQERIKLTSEKYRPVANRSSLIFFLMNDLVKVHSYYIYSLAAFTKIFYKGIDIAEKVEIVVEEGSGLPPQTELNDDQMKLRCKNLIDSITLTVFNYLRRGIFERDKLTVASMLALKIMVNDKLLPGEDVNYLIMGKLVADPGNMGPLVEWLPTSIWPKIKALEGLKRFASIGDAMQNDSELWMKWFDCEAPEKANLPGEFQKSMTQFDRLILLRAMRPDRLTHALRSWLAVALGKAFVYQQPFNMAVAFEETSNQTPTFFVLFPGVDPTPWVEGHGKTLGISIDGGNLKNISMGQGQEKPAEAIVEKFGKEGGWVMLQNCHLMQSWMPRLERLLEIVQETAHPNFRCFVSAEPPALVSMKNMPESLMQSCVKIANEAPSDIKSNIYRGWSNFSQARLDTSKKPDSFKTCLFCLCWFHSIVLGRRRFGQQGWSRAYLFNTGDLNICANILQTYLDANEKVPYEDLRYIFGEIMYGGHITDAWDRRTNNTYLQVLFTQELFSGMEFGPGFKSPDSANLDYQSYMQYVETSLPVESPPLFGLHANAEIGYLTNTTENLFRVVINMGGVGEVGSANISDNAPAASASSSIKDTIEYILGQLPNNFIMLTIQEMAEPLLMTESGPFVVVAVQECARMNTLLSEIRRSLIELDKGLKGQLNMSQAMEDLQGALTINEWPGRMPLSLSQWEKLAWPSRKSLIPQFQNLLERIIQLNSWIADFATPITMWLPGLFNPTAYLTAVMQITARKRGLPLDKMTIETHITTFNRPEEAKAFGYPRDGAFVHGLFIEGARWPTGDDAGDVNLIDAVPCSGCLEDGKLKELLPLLPVVFVKAVPVQPSWEPSAVGYLRHDAGVYDCPVYVTTFRGATYIFLATLNSRHATSKWVLTGTAIIMQTDF